MARRQRGLSLIELVVFIVIVGVAMAGIFSAINYNVRHSADPVVKKQALAIAESMLEEIMLQNFTDPDGVAEASRDLYDDIDDYSGYTNMPVSSIDDPATPIAGLADYKVSVSVAAIALQGLPAGETKRIAVTVTGPLNTTVTLEGYRTNYSAP